MSRAATNQAKDTFNQAQSAGATAGKNANDIYSTLLPQYEQEAQAPQGFAPGVKAGMETAAAQTIGGSTAGAVGRGNLMAARTRNRGGFQVANDEAAREGTRQLSDATLGVEGEDAKLKEIQRQSGIAGEAGLYGQNSNELMQSLGAENNSTGELNQAGQNGWLQNTLGVMNAVGNLGKAAGGMGVKVCWIAAELYGGWDDPRTQSVRNWLMNDFSRSLFGRAVMALYSRFGERVAAYIKTAPRSRALFQSLFDAALRKARAAQW